VFKLPENARRLTEFHSYGTLVNDVVFKRVQLGGQRQTTGEKEVAAFQTARRFDN
jgi:hypothetical protein